jgi:hypothetical protein
MINTLTVMDTIAPTNTNSAVRKIFVSRNETEQNKNINVWY